MPDQRTSENWRLEEGGTEDDKWLLQESEQQVSDQWQLQEPPVEPINSWQPVEYVKTPRPAGTWILPTIITVALLVTLGYAGYRVLPAILNGETNPTPTAEAVAAVPGEGTAAPAQETPVEQMTPADAPTAASNVEPLPTTAPPEATATTALISQDFATVNSPFGVNARFSPNTDAAIIRILENGENLMVFGQQGEWIELFVADTPLTEGEILSGTVGFAATEFFTVSPQQITQGLLDQVLAYAGKLPTSAAVTETVAISPEASTGVTATGSTTTSAPLLTVTINSLNGVNVRRLPIAEETNIIRLLENGAVLPATGRSADNAWIQVTLPDALSGWIAAEFLVPSADIALLPVVDGNAAPVVATPATPGVAPVDATDVVTSGVEPPAPYTSVVPSDSAPAIIVSVVDGVNARTEPALEADVETVVPQGAVLPAMGRSADNQWVQVQLPTGVLAWIFRDTVTATPAVGALPAVGGEAESPVLLPTPTPNPAATPEESETPTDATPEAEPESDTVSAEVVPFFVPLYSEPDNESETVARSPRGSDLLVVGQSADGGWLQVSTSDGISGWVVAGNVRVTGDVSTIPVVE